MRFYKKMSEETWEDATVLYRRRTGAYGAENYALMADFKEWLSARKLYREDTVIMGVPLDDPDVTEAAGCRYDVCVMNSADVGICSDEVQSRRIEGGRYVVFLFEHTAPAVQRAWMEFRQELETHHELLDHTRPVIERYDRRLVDAGYCELCVPVL